MISQFRVMTSPPIWSKWKNNHFPNYHNNSGSIVDGWVYNPRWLPMCMQNLFIYSFIVDDVIIFCYDVIYPFLCVWRGKNLFQHEIFGRAKISFLAYPCQNVRSLVEKKIIRTFIFQKISNLLMSYFRYCIKPKVFSTST